LREVVILGINVGRPVLVFYAKLDAMHVGGSVNVIIA
jgi:hypothetical protein